MERIGTSNKKQPRNKIDFFFAKQPERLDKPEMVIFHCFHLTRYRMVFEKIKWKLLGFQPIIKIGFKNIPQDHLLGIA